MEQWATAWSATATGPALLVSGEDLNKAFSAPSRCIRAQLLLLVQLLLATVTAIRLRGCCHSLFLFASVVVITF